MNRIQRSPPKTLGAPQTSFSDSDLSNQTDAPIGITQRVKRTRPRDDDVIDDLKQFKSEIKDLMKSMLLEQNQHIDDLLSKQSERLGKMEEHINFVKNQNCTIQNSNQEIERSMNSFADDLRSIEKKINIMEQERQNLSQNILSMQDKIEHIERSSIKTCIEIRNVPKKQYETKEDLYCYVKNMCQHIGFQMQEADIRDVLRGPSPRDSKSCAVLLELQNTINKSRLLNAIKKFNLDHPNNKLNSANLGFNNNAQTIYVSEQLTQKMKRLLYLTREMAKGNNIAFVWCSNGRVFIRQKEGAPHIMIRSEEHIKEIKENIKKESTK